MPKARQIATRDLNPDVIVRVLTRKKFGSFTCLSEQKFLFVSVRNGITEYQKVAVLNLQRSIKIVGFCLITMQNIKKNIKVSL